MKKKKIKYPNKEKIYSEWNFIRQFHKLLIKNPRVQDTASEDINTCDYWFDSIDEIESIRNYELHDVWTIRDNNDGLVMKIDYGIGFVNRVGYFLIEKLINNEKERI